MSSAAIQPLKQCFCCAVPGKWLLIVCLAIGASGCAPPPQDPGRGAGPGGRAQTLALTPEQEVALGDRAYRDILSHYRVLPGGPEVQRVNRVGWNIAKAAEIEPLQREINLHLKGYTFSWEFNVLQDKQ